MKCVNDIRVNVIPAREANYIYEGESLCAQCFVAKHIFKFGLPQYRIKEILEEQKD